MRARNNFYLHKFKINLDIHFFEINYLFYVDLHQTQNIMETMISKIRAIISALSDYVKIQYGTFYQILAKNNFYSRKLKINLNVQCLRLTTCLMLIFIELRTSWKPWFQKAGPFFLHCTTPWKHSMVCSTKSTLKIKIKIKLFYVHGA